jgi:hypothetical protein
MVSAAKEQGRWGTVFGGSAAALVAGGLFLAVMLGGCTTADRPLRYAAGARPATVMTYGGDRFNDAEYEHAWDVRRRVETTFTVPDNFGDADGAHLFAGLHVEVPEGCADRTVRWEVLADGTRIGGGRLRWLRVYEVRSSLRTGGLPDRITLRAQWDGGSGNCPSFTLSWDDPKVYPNADFDFLDPDFYPW